MGTVKVCVHKRAKKPFLVETTGIHLFSLEELAYYLHENIYLMDDRVIGEKLYSWIEWDLDMPEIAEKLRAGKTTEGHVYNQIMTIINASEYYEEEELFELSERIRSIAGLKIQERMKYKADELMQNENYWAAVTEYEKILSIRQSSRLSVEFYAKVWNNLGACYGRLFLFEKAAVCYENAFQFQKIPEYKECAYYAKLLDGYVTGKSVECDENVISEEFVKQADEELAKLKRKSAGEVASKTPEELMENWKKNYSRISCI